MPSQKRIVQCFVLGFIFVCLFFASLSLNDPCYGAEARLTWDPPTDSPVRIEGYYVYWGTESGNYTKRVNNGPQTSCDIIDLEEGQTYFFAATSYDQFFNESIYCAEISITLPPGDQPPDTDPGTGGDSPANQEPVADAGPDQMAFPETYVLLDGSHSMDPDGDSLSYLWSQTQGTSVTLDDPTAIQPSFVSPDNEGSVLAFRLTVTDSQGLQSDDICTVGIEAAPVSEQLPDLTGNWLKLDKKCGGKKCSIFATFRVKNVGDEKASNSLVKFYISNDATFDATDQYFGEDTVRNIKVGTYVNLSLRVDLTNIGQSGTYYYLIAVIDPANSLKEMDEENNTMVSEHSI